MKAIKWLTALVLMACVLSALPVRSGIAEDTIEAALLRQAAGQAETTGLEVYFLDLGRVDGILIRCDGETSFIDVGFKRDASPAIKYLKSLGVEHLDSYIGSHGHADHIEGAPEIIKAFQADRIYVPHRGVLSAIRSYADGDELQAIEAAKTIVLEAGDSFSIGGALVRCLGPLRVVNCGIGDLDENDNSLILRLDYYAQSFLFTGDTSDNVLRAINKKYPGGLDVDVLKNPHHNGAHDRDVIQMITPKITVFSTDNANVPLRTYRNMLSELGSAVYLTGSDNLGNIAIRSDGMGLELRGGYPVSSVVLNQPPSLYVGQEYNLTGTIEPSAVARYRKLMGWTSSDPSVVKVSGGKLTALAEGEATVTMTAFNDVSSSVNVRVMSASVELDTYRLQLAVGDEGKIKARVLPKGTTGMTGEWLSTNESVAVVTDKGEVLAAQEGTAQIIARLSNGAEAICEVTVTGIPIKSIALDQHKVVMALGDTLTLNAAVTPDYVQNPQLEWQSSDESILWVDNYGNVTAVGTGIAKIGVRASTDVYDVCAIKVE